MRTLAFAAALLAAPSLALPARAADDGDKVALPPGVELSVPKGMKYGWAIKPSKKPRAVPELFTIDRQGRPWFGMKGKVIANPIAGEIYQLKDGFRDLAWMHYGQLLVGNERSLGDLAFDMVAPNAQGLRNFPAALSPWIQLPGPEYKLYSGEGCGLFLAGKSPKSGKYGLIFLEIKDRHTDVRAKPARFLFESETPIHAVAGDCTQAWFAMGRVVAHLPFAAKKMEPLFAAGGEQIRELQASPHGFFYATDAAVGFFKDGSQYLFMKAPRARVRVRGDFLFVMFEDGSVFRMEGLAGFAKLGQTVKDARSKKSARNTP